MKLKIRRATDADLSAVLVLVPRLTAAFSPPPWRSPEAMTQTDLCIIEDALHAKSDDPAIFVAEIDSAVVGFVHVHSVTDYFRRCKHGHVSDIAVAEKHEGKGVATTLIGWAEDWARAKDYDWLTISVFEQNSRAENLYRKLGFGRDVLRLLKPL